ncbi:TetR/AcrR family transcriptional regulator [Cohnella soli]|uniref:TetR/AcrR family transcriptional regulator n=1 Tax=Cohnella soli TaxID=425005 RepID=A0ABW0HLQ0_9BACL
MRQFAQSGVNGLVIEKMSSELGCSKSSFYWYFKNRKEFISRVVNQWSELSTQLVICNSSVPEKTEDKIINMLDQMFSATRKGDFLFYLRKLGKAQQSFQGLLENIEQTRLDYAKELFVEAGMDSVVAEQKSQLLYHYYLGWYERNKHVQVEQEELNRHVSMLRQQLLGI